MTSLVSQVSTFGVMVVAGAAIGLLFDVYRVVRSLAKPGSTGTMVMDIVFWVLATPATFMFLLVGNWGEVRLYVFLGIALGLFAYFQVASPLVLWAFISWMRWIGRILSTSLFVVVKAVETPILIWRRFVSGRIRLPHRRGRLFAWGHPSLKWVTVRPFWRR